MPAIIAPTPATSSRGRPERAPAPHFHVYASTQPATNAGPLLRALGVISIRMTAMMDSTLMSTAIASGRMPPIA